MSGRMSCERAFGSAQHASTYVTHRTTTRPAQPIRNPKMFSESRRLRDELRTTHARIAVLEAERNDYLRKDRRAGVLTLDAFR